MEQASDQRDYRKDFEEAYLANDFFLDSEDLPANRVDAFQSDIPEVLPSWLNETRIVCSMVAICGLFATLFNLDFFYWQIQSPILLNLTLLGVLVGFANCLIYPYALTYGLINGTKRIGFLRGMNSFLLAFMAALVLFLFSFPVSGLGLALILVPAPLLFAWQTRRYLDSESLQATSPVHRPFGMIFNHDLRRLAWLTFIVLFSAIMGLFFALVFNVL